MIDVIVKIAEILIPSRKDILEWELQELRKLREEFKTYSSNYSYEPPITTENDLINEMKNFLQYPNMKTLERCKDYIMRYESCSFCRSLISTAYLEFEYGRVDRAKDIIRELIKVYGEK